ncbi:hypothetical protein SSCG_00491 [Streptomyces clavuligerus]|nr:hypothetical protein SSCG_00491 [Streptomyces clavuligerus]
MSACGGRRESAYGGEPSGGGPSAAGRRETHRCTDVRSGAAGIVEARRCHACQLHPRGQHGTSRGRYPDSRISARRPPSRRPTRQWRNARRHTPRSQWRDRAGITPASLHRGPCSRLYSWTS